VNVPGVDVVDREKEQMDELTREVRRVIEENRRFLERVMDDEFEPEDEPDGDVEPESEL
jgi:hypothetical protein